MNPPRILFSAILMFLAVLPCRLSAETAEEKSQRMAWFREARFGMFIHWGLYAIPAGEWKGKKFHDNTEWIQDKARIPTAEYLPLKDQFNPVKYNPENWVLAAKNAGMKYIVITSKHHDGFCLWDSAHTDWDVASTPYGKDLLKPLAEACARHGVKLCFYHSIMDWHHPEYGTKAGWRGNANTENPDMDKYTGYMKAQLEELLQGYGEVGILWFDGEWEGAWTHERGKDLYAWLRAKSPGLIINNRVDKGRSGMQGMNVSDQFMGDYGTPEQEIPPTGLPGVDWESCMTMNNTWGYSAHDQNWKSTQQLLRNLIDIASKGGNYLLNVGPTAEGEIPAASLDRLSEIGEWMKTNAAAIHGTQASPFPGLPVWGRCTTRRLPDGNTRLYLSVFDWPKDNRIALKGLENRVLKASSLAAPGSQLGVESANQRITLTLPAPANPPDLPVVFTLDIEGAPQIQAVVLAAGSDGILQLNAEDATLEGKHLRLQPIGTETNIGFWSHPEESISFPVEFATSGAHAAVLRWSCPPGAKGSRIEFRLFDKDNQLVSTLPWTVEATQNWMDYQNHPVGVLAVPSAGKYTLRVVALDKKGEGVMNFATLRIQPAQ